MKILIDFREKKFKHITDYFEQNQIPYEKDKTLSIGDYRLEKSNNIYIERKADFRELSNNCGKKHAQFKAELERLDKSKGKMYIVIENNSSLEDVKRFKSRYQTFMTCKNGKVINTTVDGERMYNILTQWKNKHNIEYVFCKKQDTAKTIIKLLKGDKNE